MRRIWFCIVFLPLVLVVLPLTGVMMQGGILAPYLEFPPLTIYVQHAPFSWSAFIFLVLLLISVLGPLILHFIRNFRSGPAISRQKHPFPWWGYGGVNLAVLSWFLAWNRFQWFESLQFYTFLPLWLGYIISINSLTYVRTGHCLLISHSRFFLALFPASALFWWFFEYLNRFVQNWHYLGVEHFSTGEYILHASLCFSTVLPAVQSTGEFLTSFQGLASSLKNWWPVSIQRPNIWGWILLALACPSLAAISIYPNYLFPMLWVAPLLVITGVQAICGGETIFRDLPNGDWHLIWLSALAALVCGFFWEMWNVKSLAHWHYSVPYVQRFHIFEMPILGYGGYLPFGLECMVVSRMLDRVLGSEVYCKENL
ncbi:hypothetical protein ACFLYW_02640 [Thermodesulfobacteriota bacterium]